MIDFDQLRVRIFHSERRLQIINTIISSNAKFQKALSQILVLKHLSEIHDTKPNPDSAWPSPAQEFQWFCI